MFNRLFSGIKNLVMSSTIKPDVVFVLGAPGAGKGTQCENIVKVRFGTKCSYPAHYAENLLEYLCKMEQVQYGM